MKREYRILEPAFAGSIEAEWELCVDDLKALTSGAFQLIKTVVFINVSELSEYEKYRQLIISDLAKNFGTLCPVVSVLAQPPASPYSVAVEAVLVDRSETNVEFKEIKKSRYCLISSGGMTELWACGMGSGMTEESTYDHSKIAFEEMHDVLSAEGLTFDHVVRQWNYISGILDFEQRDDRDYQHYQIFNEVRNRYYRNFRNVEGFPAATGIGINTGGVIIDFCANTSLCNKKVISVENPMQVNAYGYGQEVLEGDVLDGTVCKQAPQFERGKLIVNERAASLFISGTAAIIGQNTIGKGDVFIQTQTTIDHIAKLASSHNIKNHISNIDSLIPEKYLYIRVYVKKSEDFENVRSICTQRFGSIPALYVKADVCRDDLLVEIESEMG